MRKGLKRIGVGLVAVGLCLVVLMGSVAPAKAEPERGKVVKIGCCTAYLGPLATIGVPACNAWFDCVRYVNEQGGINGVKIETVWRETRGFIPDDCIGIRRLAAEGALIVQGTPADPAVAIAAQRAEVPANWIDALISTEVLTKPHQWLAVSATDWVSFCYSTLRLIKNTMWTEARPLRLGYMGYEYPAGLSTLEGLEYKNGELLAALGIELVGHESFPFLGCIDTSTEWLRLAGKKPDWVYLISFGAPSVTAVKDAARLGIQQKGIKLVAGPNSLGEAPVKVTGKDADGWYTVMIMPPPSNPEIRERIFPGLKIYANKEMEYRGIKPEELTAFGVVGWMMTLVAVEAIRLAMEKVGYENLTGGAVRDALFGGDLVGFDTGCAPPIVCTETTPYLIDRGFLCEIREGRFELVGQIPPTPCFWTQPEEFEEALLRESGT